MTPIQAITTNKDMGRVTDLGSGVNQGRMNSPFCLSDVRASGNSRTLLVPCLIPRRKNFFAVYFFPCSVSYVTQFFFLEAHENTVTPSIFVTQ
jgi:hypothetical protein